MTERTMQEKHRSAACYSSAQKIKRGLAPKRPDHNEERATPPDPSEGMRQTHNVGNNDSGNRAPNE